MLNYAFVRIGHITAVFRSNISNRWCWFTGGNILTCSGLTSRRAGISKVTLLCGASSVMELPHCVHSVKEVMCWGDLEQQELREPPLWFCAAHFRRTARSLWSEEMDQSQIRASLQGKLHEWQNMEVLEEQRECIILKNTFYCFIDPCLWDQILCFYIETLYY